MVVALVETKFVLVALVNVAFATSILESEMFPTERFVIVALVRVPLEVVKFEVEAFKMFPVIVLVVEEFVVLAFDVIKFAEFPNRFEIYEFVKLEIFANRVPRTFWFMIEEVAARS